MQRTIPTYATASLFSKTQSHSQRQTETQTDRPTDEQPYKDEIKEEGESEISRTFWQALKISNAATLDLLRVDQLARRYIRTDKLPIMSVLVAIVASYFRLLSLAQATTST